MDSLDNLLFSDQEIERTFERLIATGIDHKIVDWMQAEIKSKTSPSCALGAIILLSVNTIWAIVSQSSLQHREDIVDMIVKLFTKVNASRSEVYFDQSR